MFQAMFSIDRPARGPFFELLYQLFGIAPLPYHLASFIWRFLSGVAALWLFRQLWPSHPRSTMWMALLFVLFPGYLRWMEGFEDQPRMAGLFLEALSIALTLKAITTRATVTRVAAWTASILTGWAYLALVDFALGMEVFRFLCVFTLVSRENSTRGLVKHAMSAARAWVFAATIPAGFLVWRLFIFHNTREQTDIARQLGAVFVSPASTVIAWLAATVQSASNVALLAWATPLIQNFFGLRPRYLLLGGLLAAATVACVYGADRLMSRGVDAGAAADHESNAGPGNQAIWLGALAVFAGVLPVVVANRHVDFQSFSHYALPASLAGATFVGGLVLAFPSRLRAHAVALLVASAVAAHFTYATQVIYEERTISTFWHQMAWRAPSIQPGTTLFVSYPGIDYAENLDAAGGPPNLIYFSQPSDRIPVTYPIAALRQEPATTEDVLDGADGEIGYRTHVATISYEHLLVLSQPTSSSCVHAIDPRWPLFSGGDTDQVRIIGPYSSVASTIGERGNPELEPSIFGAEPPHGWCYYFEKADLALQSDDWNAISRIGKQAAAANLHPEDPLEWTPFVQAYAVLGDEQQFISTTRRLGSDPYVRMQVCKTLRGMLGSGYAFPAGIQGQMNGSLICRGG